MIPEMMGTGCYRGFYATYELTDKALFLLDLTLREMLGNYLPINGVEPEKADYQATYRNLHIEIPFTGKIRLAKDFIQELYIHMGFQKASAFKTVIDFTIKNGKIILIKDRSAEMKKKRGAFKKHYESGNLMDTIEDAFSLDMDQE